MENPQVGDALLFYNHLDTGELDWRSLHSGLPCDEEKWIANHWIHLRGAGGGLGEVGSATKSR